MAGDVEAAGSRVVAEVFRAVEGVFREGAAISLQVKEVIPEVAGASLAVAVFLVAAISLAAVAVVSPEAETVFRVVVAGGFPEAAIVFPAEEAATVRLDITVLRTIPRCSPISADRARVAAECHRVQPEVNPGAVVHRREEALHNCPPEIGHRKFPLAMKPAHGHVPVIFHPSASAEAMPAIFWASPAGSELALPLARQPQIGLINFLQIVLAVVNSRFLLSNVQIGTRAR